MGKKNKKSAKTSNESEFLNQDMEHFMVDVDDEEDDADDYMIWDEDDTPRSGWSNALPAPTTTKTVTYPSDRGCKHCGVIPVFEANGVTLYASTKSNVEAHDARPHLNCSGYTNPAAAHKLLTLPRGFEGLLKYQQKPGPRIAIDWTDGEQPPVEFEFWPALLDILKEKGYKELVIYCVGSHGRTGTALAALDILCNHNPAVDAVDKVRINHCKNAIETQPQIRYLLRAERWARNKGWITAPESDTVPKPRGFGYSSAYKGKTTVGGFPHTYRTGE